MAAQAKSEPIPKRREYLPVVAADPTKVEVHSLRDDLHSIGLTCEQTGDDYLHQFISEVRAELPSTGKLESFLIGKRKEGLRQSFSRHAEDFVDEVSVLTRDALDQVTERARKHPGAAEFFESVTEDNPGGAHFLRQLAGVHPSDPRFVERFADNNPAGLLLVSELVARNIVPTSTGTWVPDGDKIVGEYAGTLAEIVNVTRFQRLEQRQEKTDKNNAHPGDQPGKRWGVTGKKSENYRGEFSTVDAIKEKYKEVGLVASAAVVEGLQRQNLEAMLANQIGPLQEQSAENYDSRKDGKDEEILVFLALDPWVDSEDVTHTSGIGVLSVNWRLRIQRYKRKDKKGGTKHDTQLEVWVRALRYRSVYKEPANTTTFEDQLTEDRNLAN
ncbi:lectin [Streptomyces sp. NPDC057654]|uniref:lectin n=1 Tax=Streptomyces sp. NPDC057654 TaxID=3346196 RepID=UPI003695886E